MTLRSLLYWDRISKNANFVRDNIFRESWGGGAMSLQSLSISYITLSTAYHMGPEDPSNKKSSKYSVLANLSGIVRRFRKCKS